MTLLPSRRAALGLLASAAGAALPLARPARALAQIQDTFPNLLPVPGAPSGPAAPAGLRFSRVAVDTSALLTSYNASTAEIVRRDLSASLGTVFADRLAGTGGRGATLLVRVLSLYLADYAGGPSNADRGDGPDNIEGVGIVASGGRVLSQTPVYTTLTPSYSGPWYLPDIDRLRLNSISYQLAYWLRREMGV